MFILYGLDYCPYCVKSAQLLNMHNIPHKITWLKDEEKDKYKKKHKMSTFPQVFYKHTQKSKKMVKIGGFEDLEKIFLVAKAVNQNSLDLRAINFLSKNI
jgi:glutaredoxin